MNRILDQFRSLVPTRHPATTPVARPAIVNAAAWMRFAARAFVAGRWDNARACVRQARWVLGRAAMNHRIGTTLTILWALRAQPRYAWAFAKDINRRGWHVRRQPGGLYVWSD